mgnify:CR=1 FL=1
MSFNKITLIGNLGKDPELRYTPQGDAVCSFTIATNERKKDKSGEFQDVTTWFKVTLWRHQAENAAKYLSKGRQVYIEGRLGVEEWTDRDGKERYTLAVTATDMQFIGTRADNAGGGEYSGGSPREDHDSGFTGTAPAASSSSSAAASAPVSAPAAADDDIPF